MKPLRYDFTVVDLVSHAAVIVHQAIGIRLANDFVESLACSLCRVFCQSMCGAWSQDERRVSTK
jgi:hypothetical protein